VFFAWPVLGFQKTECPLGWGILLSNTDPTFLLSPRILGRYHRKERKKLGSGLYASSNMWPWGLPYTSKDEVP
jgi:hypothetical protein